MHSRDAGYQLKTFHVIATTQRIFVGLFTKDHLKGVECTHFLPLKELSARAWEMVTGPESSRSSLATRKFKARLDYTRPCLKMQKQKPNQTKKTPELVTVVL